MSEEPATSPAPEAAAAPAAKPKPPARELPDYEQIAAWVEGAELPSLANLFNILPIKKFDGLVMQIRKEELLPQHWQVISRMTAPADEEFDGLAEVDRLRKRYRDALLGERRVESLRVAWRELRGKRPSLWTASDLFAAMRRIVDKKREIDFHDLLSATRDVWTDLTLPHGREQLEVLWACLGFVRKKTKK
jgi:hypothetical protein